MAQVIDELGRIVEGQKTANLSLEDIKQLVATSAKSAVGKPTPFNKEEAKPSSDKLIELFETYTKDFEDHVKEQEDYLKEMQNVLKEIADKKEENKSKEKEKPSKKDKDAPKASVWKNLDSLAKQGLKKHSIGTHDTHCEKILLDIKGILEGISAGLGGGGVPKPPKPPVPPVPPSPPKPPIDGSEDGPIGGDPSGDAEKAAARAKQREMTQLSITRIRETALKSILGVIQEQILGFDVMNAVLDGVLDKERQFVQEARKISYEIDGATKSQTGLMRTYENIDKTVKQTGKTRQEFIERYTKTLRMGIKDLKKVRAITIAQLNTEEQLGMKAGELGDTFVDWAQGLKMNEGQIAEMGRGMRDVARFTGLSGEALKAVVTDSQKFIDNLKTAGTSTAATLKNIIELQANFKKVGIDGSKLMDAMTSTNKLLTTSTSTFALLAKAAQQAGVYGKLFSGTLLQSKTAMKAMGKQFSSIANQFGIAGSTAEELRASFANMSDDMKARVNIQLKAAFDIEAGELLGTVESFENSSKTLADKLGDVNKKLKANLTLEEKAIVLEEQRKLKLSASMGALTALDEAAKSATSMGDALAKFGQRRSEFEGDMAALGQAWTSEADVARGAIQSAMDSVNKGLKAAGKQELSIDPSTIEQALKDPAAFRELTAKITKAEQEASTAAKAQLDPLSSAAQTLKEINDTLRNLANSGFSSMFNSAFGQVVVWLGLILGAALGIWKLYNEVHQIGEYIKQAWNPEKYAHQWDLMGNMAEAGLTKGSIFTHDEGTQKALSTITDILVQIKDCICNLKSQMAQAAPAEKAMGTPADAAKQAMPAQPAVAAEAAAGKAAGKQKKSPEEIAQLKAAGQARKQQEQAAGIDSAVAKSIRRKEEKNIRGDQTLNKLERKAILQDIKNNKKTENMNKLEMKSIKSPEVPKGEDQSGMLSSMGGDMAKNAAAIAILAVGVIALGTAIVFLGKKLLDFLGLDLATIMQTATAIAAVGAAGAAIAIGAVQLMDALEGKENKEFVQGAAPNVGKMLATAAAALIIGPAILLLGVAIIKFAQLVLKASGLDLSTVAEVAGVVAAIAAAGVGMFIAVNEAVNALEEMQDTQLFKNPGAMAKNLAIGAAAVIIIGPILILLGAALVKFADMILGAFGLDLATIAKTVAAVTALLVGVALIATGILAATVGLFVLGSLAAAVSGPQAGMMLLGAAALLALTPIILTLAAAVIKMSDAILGAFGLTPSVAAKVGMNVAAVILSAAAIAGAIIGAIAGLAGLGKLAMMAWSWIGPIMLGAAALLILTPAILTLAAAVIEMASNSIDIDPKEAEATGEKVAAVLWGAAKIALGIIGSVAALAGVGWLVTQAWHLAGMMILGALALVVLTPAILSLASSIIQMAEETIEISPAEAKATGDKVAAILEAAGEIASGVMVAVAKLTALGWLITQIGWMYPFFLAGAAAVLLLTPTIVGLASAIVAMSDAIIGAFGLDAKKAEDIGKTTVAVIEAAGNIAETIMWQVPKLSILGLLYPIAPFLMKLMFKGIAAFAMLATPVVLLAGAIIAIAMIIDSTVGMEKAVQATEGLSKLVDAAASVANTILWQVPKLALLGALSFALPFIIGAVWAGAGAFAALAVPVMGLTVSLLTMAKALTKQFPPEEAQKIANATASVFEASGKIAEVISSLQGKLFWLGFLSGIANWIAKMMTKGAQAFIILAKPALGLAVAMIQMGRMLISASGGAAKVKPTVEAIVGISEMIEAVSKVFETLFKVVSKLTRRKWFGFFGSNKLEAIAEATPKFKESFIMIIDFVKEGIVLPIRKNLKDAKKIQRSVEAAKAIGELITALEPIMNGLMKTVLPLTRAGWFGLFGSSKLENFTAAIPAFEKSFGTIVNFVKNGVMRPMERAFKNVSKVTQTAKAAVAIGEATKAITVMMDEVSKTVIGMTERPSFLFFSYGKSKLQKLEAAIKPFEETFGIIVNFAKNGVIGPVTRAFKDIKKVTGAIQIAEGVGKAVLAIVQVMDILSNKLAPMAEAEKASWWQFWKSDKPSKISQIETMIPKFQGPFRAIVNFLKNGLISTVTTAFPNMQEVTKVLPLVEGVGKAVSAIAGVMDDMVNKLLPMTQEHNASWYAFWDSDKPSQFDQLVAQLPTIQRVWEKLVYFVRDGLIVPVAQAFPQLARVEQALKGIELIGKAVSTVADIMETISELKDTISPGWSGIWTSLYGGVSPLEAAIPTINQTFRAVSRFVQEGIVSAVSGMNVGGLSKAVQKLQLMAKSIDLMEDMIMAFEGMIGMTQGKPAVTTGMWWWKKTTEAVAPMTSQLQNAIPSIRSTFTAIMNFVKEGIVGAVEPMASMNLKGTIKIMTYAAQILDLLPDIIGNLDDALTQLLRFTNSKFTSDKGLNDTYATRYKGWFEWIAYFVREAIVKPMNALGEVGELKAAGKKINLAAKILDDVPKIIDGLDEAMNGILDFTNSKFTSSGTLNWNISERYKGWFEWIAFFVREGVVKPMQAIGEVGELKSVGKKMQWAAVILTAFPKIVMGLNDAMNAVNFLASSKFLTTSEDNTAIANRYKGWFEWITYFVRAAIIEPAKKLGEVRELQTVAKIMGAAANILVAFPKIVQGLNGAMDAVNFLGASKFLTTGAENGKIADRYRGWFEWIAFFVRTAIIEPASKMGDVQQLATTAKIVMFAEKILSATPRIIVGLGKAMDEINNLAEDKFMKTSADNTKIANNYKGWFEWVAYFVRVAIMEPVNNEFKDIKQLQNAARIMQGMQVIIRAIPVVIKGLSAAMGLMSGSTQYLDDDFPMDKILKYKDTFADWFRKIAIFIRDGIVDPILTELPEPKTIMMAQRILTAMSSIIRTVPQIIRNTAAAMGLMSGSTQYMDDDFPMDKILMYKDTFGDWFRKIAIFIRDGIVDPILTELPDPKVIMMAQRILTAMNAIIGRLPTMIRNLAKMFGGLDAGDCLAESPIQTLAAGVEQFKGWFRSITSFLREGIIWPIIDSMPSDEEIIAAENNLSSTVAVLRALPPFLADLSGAVMNLLFARFFQFGGLGDATAMISSWFGGIANSLLNGIINPVRALPTSDEFTEIIAQLNGMTQTVKKTTEVLNAVSSEIGPLVSGWWWFSPIASIGGKASKFGSYWEGISELLNKGIIEPIKKNLPPSKEIEEAAARINALADVLMGVKTALELLSEVMMDIQGMGLDMNALQTLPLAQLMALGQGATISKAGGAASSGGAEAMGQNPTDKVNEQKDNRKEQEASSSLAKDMDTFLVQSTSPGSGIFTTDTMLIELLKSLFKEGMEVTTSAQANIPTNVIPKTTEESATGEKKSKYEEVFGPKKAEREALKKKAETLAQNGTTSGTFVQGQLQQATGQTFTTPNATARATAGPEQVIRGSVLANAVGNARQTQQTANPEQAMRGSILANASGNARQAQTAGPLSSLTNPNITPVRPAMERGTVRPAMEGMEGLNPQERMQRMSERASRRANEEVNPYTQRRAANAARREQSRGAERSSIESAHERIERDNARQAQTADPLSSLTNPNITPVQPAMERGTVRSDIGGLNPQEKVQRVTELASRQAQTASPLSSLTNPNITPDIGGPNPQEKVQRVTELASRQAQTAGPLSSLTNTNTNITPVQPAMERGTVCPDIDMSGGLNPQEKVQRMTERASRQAQTAGPLSSLTNTNITPVQPAMERGIVSPDIGGPNPQEKVQRMTERASQAQTAGPLSSLTNPNITPVRPAMERGIVSPDIGGPNPQEKVQRMTERASRRANEEVNPYTQHRATSAATREQSRGVERSSIESAHQRIEQDNIRATGSVATETTSIPTTPQARTVMPTTDVHSEVRQNAAGAEPAKSNVTSPELAEIASAAAEEVDQTKQVVTLLEQMLKIFKGEGSKVGSGGAGSPDTSSNTIGQKPANYYRWPAGKHFQTGGKQLLNIGSQIV